MEYQQVQLDSTLNVEESHPIGFLLLQRSPETNTFNKNITTKLLSNITLYCQNKKIKCPTKSIRQI